MANTKPPVPLPFGGEIAAQIKAALKKDADDVKAVFDDATARQPFSVEWRSVTSDKRDAETAEQDIRAPHVVELRALDALMGQGPAGWVRMKTDRGVFDNRKETLQLPSLVKLLTDGGYDVRLDSADVELKSGVVRSGGPVDVGSPDGTMTSQKLEVRNNGKELVFTGRVRTVLHSERPPAAKAGEPKPNEPKKE